MTQKQKPRSVNSNTMQLTPQMLMRQMQRSVHLTLMLPIQKKLKHHWLMTRKQRSANSSKMRQTPKKQMQRFVHLRLMLLKSTMLRLHSESLSMMQRFVNSNMMLHSKNSSMMKQMLKKQRLHSVHLRMMLPRQTTQKQHSAH